MHKNVSEMFLQACNVLSCVFDHVNAILYNQELS